MDILKDISNVSNIGLNVISLEPLQFQCNKPARTAQSVFYEQESPPRRLSHSFPSLDIKAFKC